MRRINLALSSIFISQVLPLIGKPELIVTSRNITIMFVNAAIWLTQPPISKTEAKENKVRDKFSVLLIVFFSVVSVVSSVVDWGYFHNQLTSIYIESGGLLLIVSGIIFRIWAIKVLGKFFTPTVQVKQDHVLIESGPYSIVRHPSYLGAYGIITGIAIFFQSYIGVAVAVFGMGFSYYIRMKTEEQSLIEVFGDRYINYQNKVKKIIPFLW